MQVKYAFFCDAANVDASGKLNVLGVFQNVQASQFPYTHPKMTFVAGIESRISEAGKHQIKIVFIDEDGKNVLPPLTGVFETSPGQLNSNFLLDLVNISFPKAGVYMADIVVDNNSIRSESITVAKKQKQT